jgi:hypothetical protein
MGVRSELRALLQRQDKERSEMINRQLEELKEFIADGGDGDDDGDSDDTDEGSNSDYEGDDADVVDSDSDDSVGSCDGSACDAPCGFLNDGGDGSGGVYEEWARQGLEAAATEARAMLDR